MVRNVLVDGGWRSGAGQQAMPDDDGHISAQNMLSRLRVQ